MRGLLQLWGRVRQDGCNGRSWRGAQGLLHSRRRGVQQARGEFVAACGEGLGEGGGCERLRRCGERTGAGMLRPLLHCCEWGGWGVVLGCYTGEQKGVRRRVRHSRRGCVCAY